MNDALRTVHEDCSALRRYLITSGLLTRTRDGSSYRRADVVDPAIPGTPPAA